MMANNGEFSGKDIPERCAKASGPVFSLELDENARKIFLLKNSLIYNATKPTFDDNMDAENKKRREDVG